VLALLKSRVEAASVAVGGSIEVAVKLHTTTPTTSDPTTTSTAEPPTAILPQMSVTADFGGNPILCLFTGHMFNATASSIGIALADAGTVIVPTRRDTVLAANAAQSLSLIHAFTPPAGSRTINIRWRTSAGTAICGLLRRQLVIVEFRSVA
jgi:hypothetical protein